MVANGVTLPQLLQSPVFALYLQLCGLYAIQERQLSLQKHFTHSRSVHEGTVQKADNKKLICLVKQMKDHSVQLRELIRTKMLLSLLTLL